MNVFCLWQGDNGWPGMNGVKGEKGSNGREGNEVKSSNQLDIILKELCLKDKN